MSGKRLSAAGAALAGTLALCAPATAAPHGVKVGILTCHVQSGWGYIVGSSKDMNCDYHPNAGESDLYTGSISKFGVDVGYTSEGTIIWDVVAPSSDTRPGALQGDYAGATASATVGAGVGANVLVGGLDKSVALQPVSVEGDTGLDVSAGVGAMSLKADEPPPAALRVSQTVAPPTAAEPASPANPTVSPHRGHVVHHRHKSHVCRCRD
ncbi:MAG: DUF992 domain-containing protein [Alphaproteobacteria bacterium]|nr:DUF992 domain-containing protein [Alphaproteobacteria bacterium]MDE2629470.1 DUF992 domain-containing protein [Alphaproteobacteria bacterium]